MRQLLRTIAKLSPMIVSDHHRHHHTEIHPLEREIAELRAALAECITGHQADFWTGQLCRDRLREIDRIAASLVYDTRDA